MLTTIPEDGTSIASNLDAGQIDNVNNRLMMLKSKMNNLYDGQHISILGDSKVHKDVLNEGIDRLVSSVIGLELTFATVIGHLSKLENYHQMIAKP